MSHGYELEFSDVDARSAALVAQTMQALSTVSRVRILSRLAVSPCTVGELAIDVEMEQSAASHQLRLLRHLGLVTGARDGHHVIYSLYDSHVTSLLREAFGHSEHVRLRLTEGRAPDTEDAGLTPGKDDATLAAG